MQTIQQQKKQAVHPDYLLHPKNYRFERIYNPPLPVRPFSFHGKRDDIVGQVSLLIVLAILLMALLGVGI